MPDTKTPAVPTDEGEPQTQFIPPHEGGAYLRNEDGSLTRVEGPTKIIDIANQE